MDGFTQGFVDFFSKFFSEEVVVAIISMFPFIELKGGLLAASIMDVSVWIAIPLCFIANIIPMPIFIIVVSKILDWIKDKSFAGKILTKLDNWIEKKRDKVDKYAYWGIVLMVINPMPGTGGYACSLLATCLNLDKKKTLVAVIVGLFFSALLMASIYYGFIELFLK